MAATAKEIAEKLGISPSAVSLALNGKPGVGAATRERIIAEAIRMGYSVKEKSISLPNIRYVIFIDEGSAVKESSFYSIVLQGVETRAKDLGYNVFISYFYADGDWDAQATAIASNVSGMIVLGTEINERHIHRIMGLGITGRTMPVVVVDYSTHLADIDCVVADNRDGAYQAVSYLLSEGHRDVGYLRARNRVYSFQRREVGLMQARQEHGLGKDSPLCCVEVGISSEQAFHDMSQWLSRGQKLPSAFFADNDVIAAACIRALKVKGYRVPEDVSVVGFDDSPISRMVDPPLTTVHTPKELMGQLAMDFLHRRIQDAACNLNRIGEDVLHTTISTRLIKRESVSRRSKRRDGADSTEKSAD